MIRDTWRAVLVVVTAALLREVVLLPRPVVTPVAAAVATNWQSMPPTVATGWQPQWAAMPVAPAHEHRGPLRRVAKELVDLADTVIEVVR